MIDCVLIDNNYDGKTFHTVYADVPEKKNDLVDGKYEIEIPSNKVKVAVKIIDLLGEEVVLVEEILKNFFLFLNLMQARACMLNVILISLFFALPFILCIIDSFMLDSVSM